MYRLFYLFLLCSAQIIHGRPLTVRFLAAGHGDAAVIRTPGGRTIIVDCGGKRFAAMRYPVLLPTFGSGGIKLLILSHAHEDHIGGWPVLIRRSRVGRIIEPGFATGLSDYRRLLTGVVRRRIPIGFPFRGAILRPEAGITLSILSPPRILYRYTGRDINNNSLVFLLRYGRARILFTGDAEQEALRGIFSRYPSLRCDVVKVPHHGSRTGLIPGMYRTLRARWAVVTDGTGRHLHGSVRRAIAGAGTRLMTTRYGSDIFLTMNPAGITDVKYTPAVTENDFKKAAIRYNERSQAEEISMKIHNEQGRSFEFPEGISVLEILASPEFREALPDREQDHTVAARMDYAPVSLATRVDAPARIHPIPLTTVEGRRIYQKSLVLVLFRAFRELFPEGRLRSLHSISKGIYHTVSLDRPLTREDTSAVKRRMLEIIDSDMEFEELAMERLDAIAHFRETGSDDKVELLETMPPGPVPLIRLDGMLDLRLIPAVPSTGFLRIFDLVFHYPGLILRFPRTGDPTALPPYSDQKGLFRIFSENREWAEILEIHNTGELNRAVLDNRHGEIIKLAEALHEKKIASIADRIAADGQKRKFILIAGPSSSGKTTFSKRLAVQLRVNGIRSTPISTDDYFRNREDTPRDEDGNYNFEDLEALDLDLFNRHLRSLLQGEPVTVPNFSFELGRPKDNGRPLHIPADEPVIIEGIHCLNPELTASIPRENKFFIYVSALTQINIDDSNRIPTTDNRILRRIVRDSLFRGYSAYETINRWPSVRSGEDRNIFPFQDEADVMFNSALIYELGVLRDHALPHLKRVPPTVPEYSEAARLIAYLESFLSIPINEIPPTSILREFIGESAFRY